jgi:hypothetical protein
VEAKDRAGSGVTAAIARPALEHHTLVENLRRVLRYPGHELANLQDLRAWHAARNKDPACSSIHPEGSCSQP